ncbi:DUF6483 family protein [Peptostreptococcus faecalis]|uniref:DUF6483 family protein n=1 Tax=Peptostreptococcus faecalis TaxID=2045015 RepID=UPI000C7D09F6|nr:DUF6483 family protein [Peptostreptococcus faecalis]
MGLVDRMKNENRELVFKELMGKKYSDLDDFDVLYSPEEEILLITIKRLVLEGNINEAEDTLFSKFEKVKSINMMFIAGEFYSMLMNFSDEELKEKKFSKEEIYSGISDIKEIFESEAK